MTNANVTAIPTMPIAWLDGLEALNCQLETYHLLVTALAAQTLTEGPCIDPQRYITGVNDLFRPILEGYRDIQTQAEDLLKAHKQLRF